MERNWQKAKTYCYGCGRWITDTHHQSCPKGRSSSLVFIDINNYEFGCNKCNSTWHIEDDTFYCDCGHVQRTHYVDSKIIMEYGDKVIAKSGKLEYVLKKSGIVVVGRRDYLGQSFEPANRSRTLVISHKRWDYCADDYDNCSLPKVCIDHKPHKCNRPQYCVRPKCDCGRPKGCTNLNHNCSLPKIYVSSAADRLLDSLRNRLRAALPTLTGWCDRVMEER